MSEIFDTEYCNVKYIEDKNVILLAWKKFACFENYREPTTFALEMLRKHPMSNFVIDARNGFEDEKEDVEWGFSFLLPEMSKTDCKKVAFIMDQVNDIEGEMDMWSTEFGKYFTVYKATTYEEALYKMMDYINKVIDFIPFNEQESQDKKIILSYIEKFPNNILLRDNEFAHITSSGFIMNEALDKVLMIHHNIRGTWAWTGGHVDGDTDFLHVAIKEAKEETGINLVTALTKNIVSIDILPVYGHVRRNKYVSAHLHLSVAYVLIASEEETLIVKEDENSDVKWFALDQITEDLFDIKDVYLYNKLIHRAKHIDNNGEFYNC